MEGGVREDGEVSKGGDLRNGGVLSALVLLFRHCSLSRCLLLRYGDKEASRLTRKLGFGGETTTL